MAGEIKINDVSIATESGGTVTLGNATLGSTVVLGTNASPIASNLVLAAGNGIDFSAASGSAAGSSSAVLDDYEEGTWSASINSTVNLANTTFSSGRYTKIGRIVILNGIISTDVSASNVLTYVVLSSAPFAPDLNTVGSGFLNDNVRTGNSQVTSSSTVYVFFPAASSPVAHTGEQIEFSITYVTT